MSKKLRVLTLIGTLCISLTACGEEQPLQSSDEIRKDLNKIIPKLKMIGKFCVEKAISDNPTIDLKTTNNKTDIDYMFKEFRECLVNNGGESLDKEFDKKTDQLKVVLQKEGWTEEKSKAEVHRIVEDLQKAVYSPIFG